LKKNGFIPAHGDYSALLCYRKAEIVYDLTMPFCRRFLSSKDRTVDQMIQAARSGKQNIVEASQASGTSKETEIKLLGVARASFEELLVDYQDYLRTRSLVLWDKESKEAQYVRRVGRIDPTNAQVIKAICETRPAPIVANVAICLIHQTNYLLDQLIRRLERDFMEEGGLRERMSRARRSRQRAWDSWDSYVLLATPLNNARLLRQRKTGHWLPW
jgi:four helix bundle suffix protein